MCFRHNADPMRNLALLVLCGVLALAEHNGVAGEPTDAPGQSVPGLTRDMALLINEVRPLLVGGKFTEAQARIALYKGPDHPWLDDLRGDTAFASGDYAAAAACYRKSLQGEPAQVPAGVRVNLGRALAAGGDKAGAADELTSALVGGTAPAATANDIALLVSCELDTGAARLALTAAELGRLRYPHDHRLIRSELAALQANARWEEMARAASAMLDGSPTADERQLAWQVLLQAREHQGDLDEAAAIALAGWRAQMIPASRLAADLQRAGLHVRAASAYKVALDKEPVTPALILAASENAARAGEVTWARDQLGKLSPDEAARPEVRRLAASLAARAGDRAAARTLLSALIKAGEGDGPTYLWAGRLAQDDGDDLAAIDAYQRAALDHDQARAAHLSLAILFAQHGRRDEAKSQVHAVLDDDSADRHALEILAWIESLH